MKRLAYAAIAALLLASSYASLSADTPDRPDGVRARNWIQVSDRLGIVIPEVAGPPAIIPQVQGALPLLLEPPLGGYFMVKRSNGWVRLVVVEPIKGPAGAG